MGHEEHRFEGSSILVVEDEYLIASELEIELKKLGARVLGPPPASLTPSTSSTMDTRSTAPCSTSCGRREGLLPLPTALLAGGTPIIFASGYSRTDVPERFASVPHVTSPISSPTSWTNLTRLGLRPHLDGG